MFRFFKAQSYDLTNDIEVFINGEKAPVHECYVSKFPINCRWPGRQREVSQREKSYFINFTGDEEVNVKVIYKKNVSEAVLKPQEKVSKPKISGKVIEFKLIPYGGYVLTLDGYQNTIHFFYNKSVDFKEFKNTENLLYFGEGLHDVGKIELSDNQTVFIDEGAVVFGVIFAKNKKNVKIVGNGTLDVSKTKERIIKEIPVTFEDFDPQNAERDFTIDLRETDGVYINGITIKDSLLYNITTFDVDNIEIANVNIIGCWRYNADGIDLHNTRNAFVHDCFLRTFDDSLVVKGNVDYKTDCDNVTFSDCVIWNDWGNALHVGVESCADNMSNITFKNCYVIRVSGSALNVWGVDYADMHNITFQNVSVEYDKDCQRCMLQTEENQKLPALTNDGTIFAPTFMVGIEFHHEYSVAKERGHGKIHDVRFENIRIKTPTRIVSVFRGDNENKIHDVYFKDIFVNGNKLLKLEQLTFEPMENSEKIFLEK